jgi:pyrimidine deaminase RibD-like protein
MRRALRLARQGAAEAGRWRPAPLVGAVLATGGALLAEAHRGEGGTGRHAEFCLLGKVSPAQAAGATVYTTLEPCSVRNPPKVSCARRLAEAGIAQVFVGVLDPNPDVHGLGVQILTEAGISVGTFPDDLAAELSADNAAYLGYFTGDRARTG